MIADPLGCVRFLKNGVCWVPARLQTLGEEVANSVSHGIVFLAAVAMKPFLVVAAIPHGAASIVGVSIFAATLAAL